MKMSKFGHDHEDRRQVPFFADRSAAQRAVDMVMPMIEAAMKDPGVGDGGFLHIVVMNPVAVPGDTSFEQAVLYERSIGDTSRWDADYAAYARAKARTSWLSGMDTHTLRELQPHRLKHGDAGVWGSAVLDGIVVATSGVHPWYDEAFSGAIAYALRAVAKARAQAHAPSLSL
jgi:hypothetical protein